jgi:hypothetical protein
MAKLNSRQGRRTKKYTNKIPTSTGTPSTNDHWGFHVTIKKQQPIGCALKINT